MPPTTRFVARLSVSEICHDNVLTLTMGKLYSKVFCINVFNSTSCCFLSQ
jgi:hypothetical protein